MCLYLPKGGDGMYTLQKLIDKAFRELLDSGLSYKTVYGANWYIWNRLVHLYSPDTIFEEKMVPEYCQEYFKRDIYQLDKSKLRQTEARYIIAFKNLMQSNMDIPFKKNSMYYYRDYVLDSYSNDILNAYLVQCKYDGNNERTLKNKYQRIRKFMIITDFNALTKEHLIEYFKEKQVKQNKTSYVIDVRLIRRFMVYCYKKDIISHELLVMCPDNLSSISGKNIPSVYAIEEIKELLDSAKEYKYEDNHLRNYAILSLITYSGIRGNDVVNLKFENISWRTNEISFIQSKTKREHKIPLIPEIGNPLLAYIQGERNDVSKYIFVLENKKQMKSTNITTIIAHYFSNSPIEIKGRHYGSHALRHSIATNLLNHSVSPFHVANVLGHSSIRCIHIYAKVNLNNLRKCVLEAPYNA